MATEERIKRINTVLAQRQRDLVIVLENIRNTHNANAIIRTMDLMGVQNLYIINTLQEPFPINTAISTGAEKWITIKEFFSIKECIEELKRNNLKLFTTHLKAHAVPVSDTNFSQPVAIAFGNEKEGLSERMLKESDENIFIPMRGMVKSFNISVSVGIILYEAIRQRISSGYIYKGSLLEEEKKELFNNWVFNNRKS